MALPTGTVTFLFTDIEGSTRLLEQLGDAVYAKILAEYRQLIRAACAEGSGKELETQGDGFLFAFSRAKSALVAVIGAQRAIRSQPWPEGGLVSVRMALHTGEPITGTEGYVGVDLHRAARICSAGHGGQILVSETTHALVEDDLPHGVAVRALGEYRLKDLARPQRLYQITAPDLLTEFPRLKSLDVLPNNLPVQLTSFIGREREIVEVSRLLRVTRLLTLTGVGGSGKTRLALQVAAEVLEQFKDGPWLVEMASLSDPGLVPQTVASALSVREQPGRPILTALTEFLQPKNMLLVLDNCEHLVDACAQLAHGLLRACPNLRILATSREGLRIAGESAWQVPRLSLPDPQRLAPLDGLMEFEAIRLFVDRAKAVHPTFRLTDRNALVVTQICRQLDGLPLAIELAAARVNVLSPEQIAERLRDRFRLLTGGGRTTLPRHQTLRAAIDWSYDLLSEKEVSLFRRLSVFSGGWTLESAQAVCPGDAVEAQEVLDLLARLVNKSLVVTDAQGPEARYQMLETVRQYCRERLQEAGEAERFRDHHRECFLEMAEEAESYFRGAGQTRWLNRLEIEHDNLRAALDWGSTGGGAVDKQLRLAGALWRFWTVRGYFSEGRGWLEGARAGSTGASAHVRAKALHAVGYLSFRMDDLTRANAALEEALALYREVRDTPNIAFSLGSLGSVAREQGQYERAATFLEEGLALARSLGDPWVIARSLGNLGVVEEFQGNYPRAARLLEESLAVSRQVNDRFGIAYALEHLGAVAAAQGEHPKAQTALQGALTLFSELGDRAHIAYTRYELGVVAWLERDYGRAKDLLTESLALSREVGDKSRLARCLEALAGVAVAEDQPKRAAALFGAAEVLREAIATPLTPVAGSRHKRNTDAARAALGDAVFEAAWADGRGMTMERAIEYGLSRDP